MYAVAQRRGIEKPWLAWVPVGNAWLMGCISDQYRYVKLGQVKNKRKLLMWLEIGVLAGTLVASAALILLAMQGIDLLKDARYLAENAAITADCAIRLAGQGLKTVFRDLPILVIGWGRIGKCLAAQLRGLGADVTVAARKDADRAMLAALGYQAIPIEGLETCLPRYRIVFNTVPSEVISQQQVRHCRRDCMRIDLASVRGIAGEDVLWARGLPGTMAPEAAGRLIGSTALRLAREEGQK